MKIRAATHSDTGPIADIIQSVWRKQTPDPDQIYSALIQDTHQSFVVDDGKMVVGFVDCFLTVAADGCPRYELDLMAVLSALQGQGLGKKLIDAAVQAGKEQGAATIRALVKIDNVASSSALLRQGFATDNLVCTLNVSSQSISATVEAPAALYIVAVQTFSYNGFWLENDFSEAALRYGQHRRTEEKVDVVGVLIPTQQINDGIRESGYTQIGKYRWWTRRL